MKKFSIKVNGKEYEVEVEEIGGSQQVVQTVQVEAAPKAVAKKATSTIQGKEGSIKVSAPMPGTILDVKVKPGDQVKEGDTLLILEAMKMENEIAAPKDGIVASINVEAGVSVESGQLLASMN